MPRVTRFGPLAKAPWGSLGELNRLPSNHMFVRLFTAALCALAAGCGPTPPEPVAPRPTTEPTMDEAAPEEADGDAPVTDAAADEPGLTTQEILKTPAPRPDPVPPATPAPAPTHPAPTIIADDDDDPMMAPTPGSTPPPSKRSPDAIRRALAPHRAAIARCWKDVPPETPMGGIALSFTIAASGEVTAVTPSSGLPDRPKKCLVQTIRRIRFAALGGGGDVVVSYPLNVDPAF